MRKQKIEKTEPRLGISSLRVVKKDSKVKAFFDIFVPTEFGDMMIRNFRIVDVGTGRGPFVSLPNRLSKKDNKYYSDILFKKRSEYDSFYKEVSRVALEKAETELEKVTV